MNLVSPSGISSVDWLNGSLATLKPQPLTWYKVMLDHFKSSFLNFHDEEEKELDFASARVK